MAIPEINLLHLCKEYFCREDQADPPHMNVPIDIINMDNITVEVMNTEWEEISQPSRPFSRLVNITKASGVDLGSDAPGQMCASKDCKCVIRVTISGPLKGLNRMLHLPLQNTTCEVINTFGQDLKIDPGKAVSEVKENITLSTSIEKTMGPNGASAIVSHNKKQYTGRFTCTVVAKGPAVWEDLRQQEISEIIQMFQREGNEDLREVGVTDEQVFFPITGEVELRWGHEQSVEWI